jgi:phospholipid-binding lipoprotein MlaA
LPNPFDNLSDPWTAINQLLQGRVKLAASDTGRFLLNSTVGVGGFFDVATPLGLARHQEDIEQTLGVWGVPQGPYVVL